MLGTGERVVGKSHARSGANTLVTDFTSRNNMDTDIKNDSLIPIYPS